MKTTADRLTKRQEDLPRRPQDAEVAVMNIDIVTRLRIVWTSCTDRINKERADAADEIERLRKRVDILEELYLRSSADAKTTVG